MELKELLQQQKALETQIQQAIKEGKKTLKARFQVLIDESGLSRQEVLDVLGLQETKVERAPRAKTKGKPRAKAKAKAPAVKLDLPKGTVLTNGTETWEVGSRGKKPSWVAEAVANDTYKSLVQM